MSHLPPHLNPHGQPPPYGHPTVPGYVPAVPVVMPVYPHPQPYPPPPTDTYPHPSTQPTYITNHYYNPPVDQVQVVDHAPVVVQDPIDWVPANTHNADALSYKAVVAGKEPGWNSSPLWVIRAHHAGQLIPGKLAINERRAYIPNACLELPVHHFEILCAPATSIRWVSSSHGQVPQNAIPGGNTHTGETLYIGRTNHMFSVTPGKIHPSHGCLYISFGGKEVKHKHYEVLCRT